MSAVMISAIKADIGGYVGHSAVHPDLLSEAAHRVHDAVAEGLLIDGSVNSCGDDVNVVMTQVAERMHERSEVIEEPAPAAA